MIFRILKKCFPMDRKIDNATLDEYKTIRNIALSIFLFVLQVIYLHENLFQMFFKNEDIADFVVGLLISATLFSFIYVIVFAVHQRIWISNNSDRCYISGKWYHIFERKIDNDKNYVRAGWIEISQNYYDLSVDAFNYDVYLENGMLKCDQKKCSHWEFTLSELNKNGKISACFTKDSGYMDLISRSGLMELYIEKDNTYKKINRIYGTFADSGNSTVKGDIKLFKCNTRKQPLFNFLSCAPKEWEDYVRTTLSGSHNDFSLKQLVLDSAKLLPTSNIKKSDVFEKNGKQNLVTCYDEMIQKYLVNRILESYPNATFIGEEDLNTVKNSSSDISFIIDPIDGTSNFANNSKFSCISVAMLRNGIIVESAVYNPYLSEMFYARKGEGAWLNDKKISITDLPLSDSIVGYTNCPYDPNMTDLTFEFGKQIFKNALDLRRMGASALEICYAACGRYQLYCEMILYPWDYAAASLIVEEAGGVISDLNGLKLKMNERCSVVAGCPTAHRDLLRLYQVFKSQK